MPSTLLGPAPLILLSLIGAALIARLLSKWWTNAQIEQRARAIAPERKANEQSAGAAESQGSLLSALRSRFGSTFDFFETDEINQKLLGANWKLKGTEYYLIQYGSVLLAFVLIGLLTFRSIIVAIGFAILVYLIPGFLLARAIQSRGIKFENQLIDVLILIRGAVRSGYSLLQSLNVVVEELPPPASEEFERVQREVSFGLSLSHAMNNLAIRRPNDDLKLVVTAININTQVGGNLSQMLDAVVETLRDRSRIFGEIRALTAFARYSSYILTILPFAVVGFLFVLSPDYISKIFEPGPYLIIPIVSLIMVILGNIWIRMVARIDV